MISITVQVRKNNFPALANINWTPAYTRMSSYLSREIAEEFATAGASRGHKWKELAPSTLLSKVRRGRSTEILVDTHLLASSFRALRLNEDALVFGTDLKKAKFHDSPRPRAQKADASGPKLPRRPLIKALERDAQQFAREVLDEIKHTTGGA